jgi:hypothetical protein
VTEYQGFRGRELISVELERATWTLIVAKRALHEVDATAGIAEVAAE